MSHTCKIRLGELNDAPAIAQVHVASWRSAYRPLFPESVLAALSIADLEAKWKESIVAGTSRVFVAEADGAVIGFLEFGPSRDDDAPTGTYEILALYVDPNFWCRGSGRALCRGCISAAAALGANTLSLWTLVDNGAARRFYRTVGFSEQSGVKRTYERGGVSLEQVRYVRTIAR
jgi:ribosomal protein S18 acetylase RimI-like enzyme